LLFVCVSFTQSGLKSGWIQFYIGSIAVQIFANSAFGSGLAGVQNGQQRVNQAASDIASINVAKPVAETPAANLNNIQAQPVDLATSLVDLQVGKEQVQAGAKVIKTADDVLGTLLDIRA
jgi:flagellar hook protein FlgE